MMIWKFPLPIDDEVSVKMPRDARVLSVAVQEGAVVVWAVVNPLHRTVSRRFRIVGTGHPFNDLAEWQFVGTVQTHGGALVWHVFVEPAPQEPPQ